MPRRIMTVPTYGWDDKNKKLKDNPDDLKREMCFSDQDSVKDNFGMPITKTAFLKMLEYFLELYSSNKAFDVKYVDFSKASLFRILCQEGCEYIRLYFGLPAPGKLSLVLEGLTSDHKPLQFDKLLKDVQEMKVTDDPADPYFEERGNGEDETAYSILKALETILQQQGRLPIADNKDNFNQPGILAALLTQMYSYPNK